jgi:hypothetical protein
MKISKYLHSCLLIEEQGTTILIDPGNYTVNEHALDLATVDKLDFLLLTHEHPDHFYLPFVKEIVSKFPKIQIITNPSIVTILQQEKIPATSTSNDIITVELTTHEKLWDKEPLPNAIFTVFNRLTHPGDAMSFGTSAQILALPLQAPWGSTNASVLKTLEVTPKVILPIHDWQWKDDFRKGMYQRLKEFFATKNIDFKAIETGEAVEV